VSGVRQPVWFEAGEQGARLCLHPDGSPSPHRLWAQAHECARRLVEGQPVVPGRAVRDAAAVDLSSWCARPRGPAQRNAVSRNQAVGDVLELL
jgi:hypothetical protein